MRAGWEGRVECRKEESVKRGESREGGIYRDRTESRVGGEGVSVGRRNL